MNKGQLVEALESRLGSKRAATEALEAVVDTITVTVAKGEKVAITAFEHRRPSWKPTTTPLPTTADTAQ